jgi:quercetin dioxygenase-like cupin family protein
MRPFADIFPADNIRHVFVGQDAGKGMYAKELRIPAGFSLISHSHVYDHLSVLASGTVLWTSGDLPVRTLRGPCAVTVEAGVEHALHAVTDAVWYCIHPTDETDPAKVDAVILEGA